ncbi:WYL domain-containing protein [Aciduricibacillus chroicocephali]|uniref:WYL domain-containing protein n=1 Tax=Aciduricibacillus chroicocephali TaxID=3054939 RepID=A0ABY9KU13_9BACI|nr:WYL domain-containing protein [Bacillaceae bacterium 44XB]
MVQSNQRRLLLLRKLIDEETDYENKISIQEIIERLKASLPQMKMDARTIRADLQALDATAFSIYSEKGKFGKLLYSRGERLFSNTELRILLDTVFAANFLPQKEKQRIVGKLKTLVSRPMARTLPDVLLDKNGPSWLFDRVQLQVQTLQNAMNGNRQIQFVYRKLEEKENVKSFAPYVLTWQDDFCYLVGKCIDTGTLQHFRVDCLTSIEILEETFEKDKFNLQLYTEQHFLRFSREGTEVEIRFAAHLYPKLIDEFGPSVSIEREKDGEIIVRLHTLRQDLLKSWILEWGGEAEVLKPESLRNAIKKEIADMQAIYKD